MHPDSDNSIFQKKRRSHGFEEGKKSLNSQRHATAKRILSTLETIEYLGAPPDLSARLMAKVNDGKSSAEDVADIVLCSPPISASLLKLCNSAYYCRGESIDSVSRAIVHLGLKTVVQFVYAMDMMGVFRGGKDAPGFNEPVFWKSSLAGALLAQEIARHCGIADAQPLFLAGLLRDIGVLVVRQYFPDLFSDVLARRGRTHDGFDAACSAVCGLDHRSIAFLLAVRWKLPPAIIAVFQPPAPGTARYEGLLLHRNIVLFSDYLLKMKKIHLWDPESAPDPNVGASLYVAAEKIDAMIAVITSEVNEFYSSL
jgi:HD-like signal output (HDOD) protein